MGCVLRARLTFWLGMRGWLLLGFFGSRLLISHRGRDFGLVDQLTQEIRVSRDHERSHIVKDVDVRGGFANAGFDSFKKLTSQFLCAFGRGDDLRGIFRSEHENSFNRGVVTGRRVHLSHEFGIGVGF